MTEEQITQVVILWGPVAVAVPAVWKFFISREKAIIEAQERKDVEREKRDQERSQRIDQQEADWRDEQKEFSERLIKIIEQTTTALTTISVHIEDMQKTAEKLRNIVEQLRYLRKFLEQVIRVRKLAQSAAMDDILVEEES